MVHQAVAGGITFFDNCWEYRGRKSRIWMGAGLKGVRKSISDDQRLALTVATPALRFVLLEESRCSLQTDHLDAQREFWRGMIQRAPFVEEGCELWKKPRKTGKFVSWDLPATTVPVHLGMLQTGFPFDAVKCRSMHSMPISKASSGRCFQN